MLVFKNIVLTALFIVLMCGASPVPGPLLLELNNSLAFITWGSEATGRLLNPRALGSMLSWDQAQSELWVKTPRLTPGCWLPW